MKKIISLILILLWGCTPHFVTTNIVDVKGLNDELETKIEISTFNYTRYVQPGIGTKFYKVTNENPDYFFRCFIDKETKQNTSQLYVQFNSNDWIWWDMVTLKIKDKVKDINVKRIGSDVKCTEYGCSHYEDVVMEINNDLMSDWVENERTLRFSSSKVSYSKDIKINSQEVKYFIDKVNEVKKSLGIN